MLLYIFWWIPLSSVLTIEDCIFGPKGILQNKIISKSYTIRHYLKVIATYTFHLTHADLSTSWLKIFSLQREGGIFLWMYVEYHDKNMYFVRNNRLWRHQSALCFSLLMYARQTWDWRVSQMGCLLGEDAGCLIIFTRIFRNTLSLLCCHSVEAKENASSTKQKHIPYLIGMRSTY